MARKRQVLTFSGAPTRDGGALRESLDRASRAVVTIGGCLIYAVDRSQDVLDDATQKYVAVRGTEAIVETDGSDDLALLVGALDVEQVTDDVCM